MSFINRQSFYRKFFLTGVIFLILTVVTVTNLGVAGISLKDCLMIILSKFPVLGKLAPDDIDQASVIIVWNLRLPRILLAALVGAGLAVTGASFQGIFKNPLVEPYVLGISSGAALGAALTMVFGLENSYFGFGLVTVNAFIGAAGTVLLVYNLARVGHKVASAALLLTGIAVNLLLSSLISLIMAFKREQIERIVMWTMGSVATADWNEVLTVFPILIGAVTVIFILAKELNLMLLGDDSAKSLGVEVEKVKKAILFTGALIVATVVSVSGIIGFVGLIVPHIIRLLFGPDHRVVIPFSALGGAILLIVCDTFARTLIPPNEIPVGAVTSICGVPFFLSLLYKNKKKVF